MPDAVREPFRLKLTAWDGESLLAGQESSLRLTEECDALTEKNWGIPSFRELVWHELCSEYDSILFSRNLHERNIALSTEYCAFESVWLKDEWRHHSGFKFLFKHLFRARNEEIERDLTKRTQSFSNISRWLSDEFSICLLLAYDENVTAQAYRLDYPIYKCFGNPNLLKWINFVALDEVHHFSNLISLIRRSHKDRLNEVAALLDRLVEQDLLGEDYSATFVLDHKGFPRRLLETARDAVLMKCATS